MTVLSNVNSLILALKLVAFNVKEVFALHVSMDIIWTARLINVCFVLLNAKSVRELENVWNAPSLILSTQTINVMIVTFYFVWPVLISKLAKYATKVLLLIHHQDCVCLALHIAIIVFKLHHVKYAKMDIIWQQVKNVNLVLHNVKCVQILLLIAQPAMEPQFITKVNV